MNLALGAYMTRKYILINGAIRDTEEFSLIVDYVISQIKSSNDNIKFVISTWIEDIKNNIEIFNWLKDNDVQIVGSPNIDVGGPANIFRQWRTLEAGLSIIPEDAFVLKGRTDKFLLRKDVINSFFSKDISAPDVLAYVENDTLCVEHVSLSLPFMAKDMIYLGTPNAIRKTISYSVRTQFVGDHIFNGIGPECFLWLELASRKHSIMQLIQCIDLRQISAMLAKLPLYQIETWKELDRNIVYLYKNWIELFDSNLGFLSDILECRKADVWYIDEGSWGYTTGDREEFEKIKYYINDIEKITPVLSCDTMQFINSTYIFEKDINSSSILTLPFENELVNIRNSFSRESSDIVLIRSNIIKSRLSELYSFNEVKRALHWNIRQRDRSTLDMTYSWLINGEESLKYLSDEDKIFVLERKVDIFTFEQDVHSIELAIDNLTHYFKKSPVLLIRLGEHFFKNRQLYRAAYYFWKAQRTLKSSLGANHGLGCALLDLGFSSLSIKYLTKAHYIMPVDQTAMFTLLRAYAANRNIKAAKLILEQLHGPLKDEGRKILNV
jgi:tetratricopeptide (TPR) repeat protein